MNSVGAAAAKNTKNAAEEPQTDNGGSGFAQTRPKPEKPV